MSEPLPIRREQQGRPPQPADPGLHVAAQLPDTDEDALDLSRYLWGVWENKWLVAAVLALSLLVGLAWFFHTPPSYQSEALVQIEERKAGLAAIGSFADYAQMLGGSVTVAAEMEVMRSRAIMSDVAERLKLDVTALPVHYPHIGEPIARYYDGPGVAKPWFGKEEYAWGGEQIEVPTFLVGDEWLGRDFTLVAGESGTYRLYDEQGRLLLDGKIGVRAEGGEELILFVSLLKARPNTQFRLSRAPLPAVAAGLADRFSARETPNRSGILKVSYTGSNPELTARILNEILDAYQRQNVGRKSAEAEQTLEFLEKQLPPLKERLDAAEAAHNAYLREHSSIDIAYDTSTVLESIVDIEGELFKLQQDREVLRERFKATHPKIQSLDGLIATLRDKLFALEKQTETLPEVQQSVLRLARDVEVNTRLYSQLINSMQELSIAKAGTVGNARIIDYGLPASYRSAPVLARFVAISSSIGLLLGIGLVLLKLRPRQRVEDPADIERQLGLSVLGNVPLSDTQRKISQKLKKRRPEAVAPLALVAPNDPAVESIRSLRTSLHFLLLGAGNNVLLISGPGPDEGKSFLAVNLAVVLAQTGKRVLLVDADMRKGHLHRVLGLAPGVGLSEFIAGDVTKEKAVAQLELPGIDFVSGGARPPNPSELLTHERFADLLRWGSQTHDFVIADAPPVLAVTDAAVIGRHAAATLLVARAGIHPMGELEESVKRMRQGGGQVRGFVLNGIEARRGYGYQSGYRYGYRYGYKYGDDASSKW